MVPVGPTLSTPPELTLMVPELLTTPVIVKAAPEKIFTTSAAPIVMFVHVVLVVMLIVAASAFCIKAAGTRAEEIRTIAAAIAV